MQKQRIALNELKRLLSYDPETGDFIWRLRRGSRGRPGEIAGTIQSGGYRQIIIYYRFYLAHTLAWFYMTGRWPNGQIDHVNGPKTDNRFKNLRECSVSQNAANKAAQPCNKLGVKGVYICGVYKDGTPCYRAQICAEGKTTSLGLFRRKEDAGAAYASAAKKYFGAFANSRGRPPPDMS